ncbi:MAG: alpha/beta hydrolase family protein, partial [Akkermansiaceae bacterium]
LGHGVTGDKDRPLIFWLARALQEKGYPALRMSFSGNGDSEGAFEKSTISKEIKDLTAVLDQVGNGKRIAYIGHSMGGAVGALTSARDERINVLVSLAGMVHTAEFCDREFGDVTPGEGNMWDEDGCPLSQEYADDMHAIENTLDAAREIKTPWLLLHGTADDVVFPKDSHDLIAVLRGASELVEIDDAGHSFEDHEARVAQEVGTWLDKHL